MAITHVTTHHLYYDGTDSARLTLRKDELKVDDHKEDLLDQLKSSFLSRLNRKHGSFESEGEEPFLPQALKAMLDEQLDFSELSRQFMRQMEKTVNLEKFKINAHFLFFVDQLNKQDYFYIFVANQSESLAISEDLEVTPTHFIDTGISLFGIKVDMAEWKRRPTSAYLTIIPPRGKPELSAAFHTATGFSNVVDTEETTLAFLEGVEAFAKQVPKEKQNDYRKKVVEYCTEQEKKDQPISINQLSTTLEGVDCEKFVREMLPHNPKGEEEVLLDRRSLKQYTRFSGKERDLSISFSSSQLDNRVLYDQQSDTITIKGLPKSLRQQIMRYLGSEKV